MWAVWMGVVVMGVVAGMMVGVVLERDRVRRREGERLR